MVKIRIFLKSREYSRVTEQMAGWCGVEVEFENFVASHIWGLGSVSLLDERDRFDESSLHLRLEINKG